MKSLIIILLILVNLYAYNLDDIKLKLISKISHTVLDKKVVKIYMRDKEFLKRLNDTEDMIFVDNCKDADIILAANIKKLSQNCKNKIIFVTKFRSYRNSKSVLGAIFWQKGRPNLIFRASTIKQKGIRLPNSYKKYIDE